MDNLQLKEMQLRMKTTLKYYAVCAIALLAISLLIYSTSNYYATAYPYSDIGALPHNLTTVALSIFNGYSEKVPLNTSQATPIQSIKGIRQTAWQSVNYTIMELLFAFLLLLIFSLLNIVLGKGSENWKRLYLLPVIFLSTLLVSQYITFGIILLEHKTPSGISLFFMDSLFTILWFGVADELLLYRFARVPPAPYANYSGFLSKLRFFFFFLAIVAILFILISGAFTFLANVGLFIYHSNFLPTYLIHSLGLAIFAYLLIVFVYRPKLLSFAMSVHNPKS